MSTPALDWLCTPDDVAALLRARTKDSNGDELGTWTDDTRPTEAEVETLIALAGQYVNGAVGGVIDPCAGSATSACALRAALLVELSYFPEQVRSDRSPYPELRELYDSAETALRSCVSAGGAEGGEAGVGYGYHSMPVTPETLAAAYAYGWRNPEFPMNWVLPQCPLPAVIDEPETPLPPAPDEVHVGLPGDVIAKRNRGEVDP
jgi:hypothetical protein